MRITLSSCIPPLAYFDLRCQMFQTRILLQFQLLLDVVERDRLHWLQVVEVLLGDDLEPLLRRGGQAHQVCPVQDGGIILFESMDGISVAYFVIIPLTFQIVIHVFSRLLGSRH